MYETNMYEGMLVETVSVPGANGDYVSAYMARPLGPGRYPGSLPPMASSRSFPISMLARGMAPQRTSQLTCTLPVALRTTR